jgi:Flp pilus assembly protein TadD
LSRDPKSLEAIRGIVFAYLDRGKADQALEFIRAQIDRNPNSPSLYFVEGEAAYRAKDLVAAEIALTKSTQLDQNNAGTFILLAQVKNSLGKSSEAIQSYQHAITLSPNNAQIYPLLGAVYESQGEWKQAEEIYQQCLAIQPENPLAANNLAYLMLEHDGDITVALTMARIARRGFPDLPNSADTLGWAYFANGAYTLAQSLLSQAVKQEPKNAVYRYHLGMTYLKLKEIARARTELEESIKLNPQAPFASEASLTLSNLSGS